MKKNPRYAFKHLSVRVPWHDNAWNGTVCSDPKSNSACLALKSCSLTRDDEKEQNLCGKTIKGLGQSDFPACLKESGAMMADFSFDKTVSHPYMLSSTETHGHLKPTNLRFPAYAACTIPYSWMLKKNVVDLTGTYDLDYDETREPDLSWLSGTDKGWVQELDNQRALLDCFYEHLEQEKSLVIFYAKQVPFVESGGRVVVGVGRIRKITPSGKYEGSNSNFSAAYWEHMVHHSIRDDMEDGFLLPYHAALEYADAHPDFDPAELVVTAPDDKRVEFSYAAEHVSNDTAIRVLLECNKSWEKAAELGIGQHHAKALAWIHNELHRIEEMRGYYPGMGAALCAFAIEKGHFIAAEIINSLDEKRNPWTLFEKALDDPTGILSVGVGKLIPDNAARLYKKLAEKDSPRIKLLHLLSRFDLTIDQAKQLYVQEERETLGPGITEEAILENPYIIYELNIHQWTPVALDTIDLGLFLKNPPDDLLPANVGSDDPLNSNRIRALTFRQLHYAASSGHTLLPRTDLIKQIRALSIEPKCEVNSDYYELAEDIFVGTIDSAKMKDGSAGYQLTDLAKCGALIRQKVNNRISAARLQIEDIWSDLLDKAFEKSEADISDDREAKAHQEKLAALKQIAASRFSVLIGPAGTGKTTLLTILASHPEIKRNGVLLLAPTGKARVRMEEIARGLDVTAKTLAQFLRGKGRFDGGLQRYKFSNQTEESYETVILDEASMLTEEMLATTLDCLQKAKRFILVGDHRQLPPIGAGRPFVDIINRLRPEAIESIFPKVGTGYAELAVRMRQGGSNREDMQLAEWFSGNQLEVSADQIINDVLTNKKSKFLRFEKWKNETEFEKVLEKLLVDELGIGSIDNVQEFNKKIGSSDGIYFNGTKDANYRKIIPSVDIVEKWQILSPVREKAHGVVNLNRRIHKWFRAETVNEAINGRKTNYGGEKGYTLRKIPKPVGPEQIVYGDKVINLSNHSRDKVWPKDGALEFLANGEIGIVTGQFKTQYDKYKGQPQYVEIEFSSQKGFTYTFRQWDFKDESEQPLELAYALTVHKAQGSEFGMVILVVPNPCFILSRELLYTALTRQKDRVVVLHQGDAFDIKGLSSPVFSDTAKRITNLFEAPELVEVDGKYLEKNLIHQASDGTMLRSKSELLIYQRLLDKHLAPIYEKDLLIKEVSKLPDFTIDNADTGVTYYWEHCGMMHDPEYVARWNEKQAWYTENEILPWDAGGGKNGKLIVTEDAPATLHDGSIRGAISIKDIDEVIRRVFRC